VTVEEHDLRSLHESERRYRSLYNDTLVMLHSIDNNGRPVRLNGVKANLFGVSLAKSFGLGSLVGSLRAHDTFGSIRAPITCARAALADPVSECFHGTLSDNKYAPNIFGADFALGRSMIGGTLRPYLGAGYNRLEPRFRVNFTNQFGNLDTTLVEVNLNRAVVFGGASWQVVDRLSATTEIYAAPAPVAANWQSRSKYISYSEWLGAESKPRHADFSPSLT
jgi:hypothetical protein